MTSTIGATLAPFISERDMQDAIRVAALRNGWAFYHTNRSDRSDPGFPDCVCYKDRVLVIFELKAQKGRVSAAQKNWIDRFNDLPNCTSAIVRPEPKEGEMSYDDALELLAAGPGGSGRAGE